MKEIERKYLITQANVWEQYSNVKVKTITQGYMSKSKKRTVRVRVATGREAFITIKGATKNFTRDEFEYSIPYDDGMQLLLLCDGDLVSKTRYVFVDEHDQRWEVDVFSGINEGLVVAEIELLSEDTPVILPGWIGLEVTFDKRYTNSYLSTHKL